VSEQVVGLDHQFEDLEQQHESVALGMWLFLASEVMFFGGMFTAYIVYRGMYPAAFELASSKLDVLLGTFNTAVLIGSSLTMALAVHAAQRGKGAETVKFLVSTIALAFVFLVVKYFEYSHKFHDHLVPGEHFAYRETEVAHSEIFFSLYFAMTGMHALHMVVGAGLLFFFMYKAWNNTYSTDYYGPIEIMGLYWHFVDIVWIFLFPMLYLIG
jgi:cytochrome c oxidase subunit 3